MKKVRKVLLRLLDPDLGARTRAVLRAAGAVGAGAAIAAKADAVAAAITALQGLLAVLVLTPTASPKES